MEEGWSHGRGEQNSEVIRNTRGRAGLQFSLSFSLLYLLLQPLASGGSASFPDSELQDRLSCQDPALGVRPGSEPFLRGTTGPGPEPRRSGEGLGPARSEATPRAESGSFPESLLVRQPLRLSEEETWLIWPSSGGGERSGR